MSKLSRAIKGLVLLVIGSVLWIQFVIFSSVSAPHETRDDKVIKAPIVRALSEIKNDDTKQWQIETSTESPANVKPKSIVAYAISVSKCGEGPVVSVIDGAAILGHSIHLASIRANATRSSYDYRLYAFLHPDASNCTKNLTALGYNVQLRHSPINVSLINNHKDYRRNIEKDGCCGSREFLKLWAYDLIEHDIVVHLDTDVMFLQPLDYLFDAMLTPDPSRDKERIPVMPGKPLPDNIDFYFTRDYLQRSKVIKVPHKWGVQGGFFVTRPNRTRLQEMVDIVLEGNFSSTRGWFEMYYSGYWGAAQIQGFLSYYYGVVHPEGAVELNRCIYNSMIDDNANTDTSCTTVGNHSCGDCRDIEMSEIKTVHMTMCRKPWDCPKLGPPSTYRCKEVHRAWFDLRQSLELGWGYEVPTHGWRFTRTLGYCYLKVRGRRGSYLPLQFPNTSATVTTTSN